MPTSPRGEGGSRDEFLIDGGTSTQLRSRVGELVFAFHRRMPAAVDRELLCLASQRARCTYVWTEFSCSWILAPMAMDCLLSRYKRVRRHWAVLLRTM